MTSPFPGMDPYLENYWPSVHTQLAGGATRALNRVLPSDLVARPEERVSIASEDESDQINTFVADASIRDLAEEQASGSMAIMAPFKLVVEFEPATERYVKILASGDRLLTVIEFLSPANKSGAGMEDYLHKRRELLNSGVHVVEVDLVRRGNWRELLRPHRCPAEAVAEYRAVIRLGGRPGKAYVYPWPIQRAMEAIQIPLRPTDPPVLLDIQQLLNEVYAEDRYGQSIDYSAPLRPGLEGAAGRWEIELLKTCGVVKS